MGSSRGGSRSFQCIKTAEVLITTLLINYFLPIKNPSTLHALDFKEHFSICVFYTMCIWSWIALMHACTVQPPIALWGERLFASVAAGCYIAVSILCIVSIEDATTADDNGSHDCRSNRLSIVTLYRSLCTMATGMVFLLHAVLTLDMWQPPAALPTMSSAACSTKNNNNSAIVIIDS